MLSYFFQFLTGRSKHNTSRSKKSAQYIAELALKQLNQVAPLKRKSAVQKDALENSSPAKPNQTIQPAVVCREAILNEKEKIEGYFFTLMRGVNEHVRKSSEIIQRLHDEFLLGSLLKMDIQRLLGHRIAFLPMSPLSLSLPSFNYLPSSGVVIVIHSLETLIKKSDESYMQVTALKTAGFQIGLQGDINHPSLQRFIDLAEYIFIDIGGNDLPDISAKIKNQVTNKSLVATNVRLLEEYHVCSKLPFHYFQGTFISSKEKWTTPALDSSRVKVLSLLSLVQQNADNGALAKVFKLDSTLSYQILRHVNSVGFGLVTKTNNIDQALLILGRNNLFRWLTLLLFTSGAGNPLDMALMENALVRARLAELCAGDSLSTTERDELFIAGIFSLLDVLLRMPMEKLLKEVSLPPLVVEALLHKSGKYYLYLDVAIACEEFDQDRIVALSDQVELDLAHINALQVDALIWAQLSDQQKV